MTMNDRISLEEKLMEVKIFLRNIILDEVCRKDEQLVPSAKRLMKSIEDYQKELFDIKD